MDLRSWCFTVWLRYAENFEVPDTFKHFKYCVYQLESCPTTGKLHLQGYVEFKRSVRIRKVKELFKCPEMHLERRMGSREAARQYCMVPIHDGKDKGRVEGTTIEFGIWEATQGQRTDLKSLAEDVKKGMKDWELAEKHPVPYMKFSKHIGALRLASKPAVREQPEVLVLYGETGSGKTRFVYDNNPLESIFRMESEYKWFDGYQDHPVVLFDEFMCQFKLGFFLQLLDRYPIRVQVKGGFVNWNPKKIYITSNFKPDLWYQKCPQASRDALKRRITNVTHMTPIKGPADLMILGPSPSSSSSGTASEASNRASEASTTPSEMVFRNTIDDLDEFFY